MNRKNSTPFTDLKIFIGYGVFGVLSVLIIGILAVSYTSGAFFLLGIIAYFLLITTFKFAKRIPKTYYKHLVTLFSILFGCLISFLIILLAPFNLAYFPPCAISYYRLTIKPKDSQLSKFKVQEFIVFSPQIVETVNFTPYSTWVSMDIDDQKGYQLPETELAGNSLGFLLKEVSFDSANAYYNSLFPDPHVLMRYNLSPSCKEAVVELQDFPLNSFYAAREANELKMYPYVDTETITWNSKNLSERGIRFAYVQPPFQSLKPLLSPFIGASSISQWIIGLIGIISAVLFTPIAKPVFTEILQKRFKKEMDNVVTPVKDTRKIIVSGKGDEKDVEIKKDSDSKK